MLLLGFVGEQARLKDQFKSEMISIIIKIFSPIDFYQIKLNHLNVNIRLPNLTRD